MSKFHKYIIFGIILFINIFTNYTCENKYEDLNGRWESENCKLYMKFSNDSISIYDNDDRSRVSRFKYFSGKYKIFDKNKIIIFSEVIGSKNYISTDTLGNFVMNDSILTIQFSRNTLEDTTVIMKRPEYDENRKLIKLQFSEIGQYVVTKYPNYDLQIDSTGFLIYNGLKNSKLEGYHKGFNKVCFQYIKDIFSRKSISKHLGYVKKYRNDHMEPHLVFFFEIQQRVIIYLIKDKMYIWK